MSSPQKPASGPRCPRCVKSQVYFAPENTSGGKRIVKCWDCFSIFHINDSNLTDFAQFFQPAPVDVEKLSRQIAMVCCDNMRINESQEIQIKNIVTDVLRKGLGLEGR